MAEALPLKFGGRGDRLFVHFDVEEHYLSLDTFIQTAESARKIVKALDQTFFNGDLGFEIIVLPPREGTFLQSLGIQRTHLGVAAAVLGFFLTPQGEAFTKGLTGQTTSEWFEDAGHFIREGVDWIGERLADHQQPEEAPVEDTDIEIACRTAVGIVTSMTRGILELGSDALDKIGMELGDLPDALEARAEFYAACIADKNVKRIGFTPDDDFPIPRNSFPERAQKPARKKKEEDEPEWVVATESIYVNSPNWNENKQKTRMWQGVDSVRHECLFVIEDAEFWGRIRRKELLFEGLDSLRVQWAFQVVDGKIKNRRVLRVLEFNEKKLAEPLTPDAKSAILGSYTNVEAVRGEHSLFEYGSKKPDV